MSASPTEIHPGETFYRAYVRIYINPTLKKLMEEEVKKPLGDRTPEKAIRNRLFEEQAGHYRDWCISQGKIIRDKDPELCRKILVDAKLPDSRRVQLVSRGSKTKAVFMNESTGTKETFYLQKKFERKKKDDDARKTGSAETSQTADPNKKKPVWFAWRASPEYAALKEKVKEANKDEKITASELQRRILAVTNKDSPEYMKFKAENYPSMVDKVPTP